MGIWKKALSAGLTAAMLASVVATSAFATVGTATGADQTNYLNCTGAILTGPETCSQVADGISTVTLAGDPDGATGSSLYIAVAGATPISATGKFTLAGSTITTPVLTAALGAADTITLRSPTAPGTAVVSVYTLSSGTGVASLEGTLTITFTASSGLDVSAANSTVKTLTSCAGTTAATSAASTAGDTTDHVCVAVKDGNNNVVAGATVTATITPVGNLHTAAGTAQTISLTSDVNGLADFSIYASGLTGTAVISTSVTVGTKTTTLMPVSFTFTGAVASLQLMPIQTAIGLGNDVNGVYFTAKDASGNLVSTSGSTVVVTTLTGVGLDNPVNGAAWTARDGAETSPSATGTRFTAGSGYHDIVCPDTATSATIAVQNGTVVSNALTVYCSDVAASFGIAFDKTTVAPGGTATISATVKDANGFPVADGTAVNLVVSSGATLATTTGTKSGIATWTFLAPFNTGMVSAAATVAGVTGTQTASLSIGAVAPLPSTSGTNASALGVTKVGPYTTATKVAGLGKYVTFKMAFGSAAAGQHVSILVASKSASGVWSTFAVKTSRVADASGDVYFYWKSASASWLSVRGSLSGAMTNAVQARWR